VRHVKTRRAANGFTHRVYRNDPLIVGKQGEMVALALLIIALLGGAAVVDDMNGSGPPGSAAAASAADVYGNGPPG
jgi:hypothetical protein